MTRTTYLQRRWPDSPRFQEIAGRWCQDQSRLLLDLVWRGYDRLWSEDLSTVPFSDDHEAKEESLNHLLAVRIDQCKNGDEPFCVQHQPPEQTKRKPGRGKSPQPDIGFVLYDHPNTVWPLEGKVLLHEKDVEPYLNEIKSNFVTARYATFSSEGAMLGYLLRWNPNETFDSIEAGLAQTLRQHPHFNNRPHRISNHRRDDPPHGNSPTEFTCHHLLLRIHRADAGVARTVGGVSD
ncbi:MAG: hypothetical protein GX621_17235 [Pirellulaceae bacterium]|nr:hypothetical protein [Pirellulaceae bacterium]